MGTSGLEPPTSRLSGVRSNHLSYAPILNLPSGKFKTGEFDFKVNDLDLTSRSTTLICFANRQTSRALPIYFSIALCLLCNFFWCNSSFLNLIPHGGDEEDRTPDPLLAKQVLSQLSYTPTYFFRDSGFSLYLFQDTKNTELCR